MEQNERTQSIRPLNGDERQAAREKAREQVIRRHGKQPEPADFQQATMKRFPREVRWMATGLLIAGLIAAFLPSMFRVFNIARDTFFGTIPDFNQANVTGASIVVLGETMMLICLLAVTVFEIVGKPRYGLYIVALCAFMLTLVGNWTIASPNAIFGYMEAVFPPLFTLALAYILERRALSGIEERHAANVRYESAMATYRAKTAAPEADADWPQAYANALRDALRKKNNRRAEVLELLQKEDWRALIRREIETENWYQEDGPAPTIAGQMPTVADKPKPAVLSVIRWLEAHPEAWQMANPAVAEQTKVSKETVRQARLWIGKGYTNGHGEAGQS